jgi:hypothetical protein
VTLTAGLLVLTGVVRAAEPVQCGTNGTVTAMAASGNTVYLGGTFTIAGPLTGGGIVVSSDSAAILSAPRFAGIVHAVVDDGSGGWFVGGSFVGVADRPLRYLVHVLADGSIADWNPQLDGPVYALAMAGGSLFVGGAFHVAGGATRNALAAFDASTGGLLGWDPESNSFVRALYVQGSSVFAGGYFTVMGGIARNHVARLRIDTGAPEEWPVDADADVSSFASSGDTLYVGGYFSRINGVQRPLLAAIDLSADTLLAFDAHAVSEPTSSYDNQPSWVRGIVIAGGSLFVAGHFIGMGGQDHVGIAELDRATGLSTAWAPRLGPIYNGFPTPSVFGLIQVGHDLLAVGEFKDVDGVARGCSAKFDLRDGSLTSWDPRASDPAYALAYSGGKFFVGGGFWIAGAWEARPGLAAIDATTGALLPWNPNADEYVITAMAAGGGKVYVSGDFYNIGGQQRTFMACLDSATAAATAWNPNPNNIALTMVLHGDAIYTGGYFTSFGGVARRYAAKLDTVQGAPLAWNIHADDWVQSIVPADDAIYLGGWFHQAGDQLRNHLAAVDPMMGTALPWNPDADSPVYCMAKAESYLFVAGPNHIGGLSHTGLVAIRCPSGIPEPWNLDLADTPDSPPGRVNTLLAAGNTVLVGGLFASIGGVAATRVAAINATSGELLPWRADLSDGAWSSATDGTRVWVGGAFYTAGPSPAGGFFSMDIPRRPPPATRAFFALAQSRPNPASTATSIPFSLAAAGRVTLIVYDLQGRRIAAPLLQTPFPAGPHDVPVSTAGWRPGCYLYRIEANGRSATRKMLVVP